MLTPRIAGAALALMACVISAAELAEPALKIGDTAPAMEPMSWIKGEPVRKFVPGRVYVVEFWATWCVPCRELMPHLSALQKQHADRLTVIGVNVRETEKGQATKTAVEKFVQRQGVKMDYTVAMDDPSAKTVFNAWMIAAGSYGLPTSFVVDGRGRVVWVGHPVGSGAAAFDTAVMQALAGTSDLAAARATQAQVVRENAPRISRQRP